MFALKLTTRSFFRRQHTFGGNNLEIIDWDYFTNPSNFLAIASNVNSRKVSCNIEDLLNKLHELKKLNENPGSAKALKEELFPSLLWFPNSTHPRVMENKSEEPTLVEKVGVKPPFKFFPTTFVALTKRWNLLRTKNIGHMSGHKSYFLKHELASLEQALVKYALCKLREKGFQLISVPDILPKSLIEQCGMKTENQHSQVFHLEEAWYPDVCLSGTAEMALASYLSHTEFSASDLPKKLCATSRCFRAEAKKHQKEKGLFRVHQFTKVEMFGVTAQDTGEESEAMLEEFLSIQKEIFSELGLPCKILEMPSCDLGLPAYHKYDIEAWIPTTKYYGEISSASNCTDYQSRRLSMTYKTNSGEAKFCHTVNATACAIPRLLIAILENFQNLYGTVNIPGPLQKYMKKEMIDSKFNELMLCTKPAP